jgi:hypothetical protein
MTYTAIGRALFCLLLGVALLASVVAFVPGPLQVLAALVVLPIESILSRGRHVTPAPHGRADGISGGLIRAIAQFVADQAENKLGVESARTAAA